MPEYKEMPLISCSDWKPFEPADMVTDTSSNQYKILHSKGASTNEHGLIYINGYLATALGQSYGKPGDRFLFVLKRADGTRHAVRVIQAEAKNPKDTAGGAGWTGKDGHVMEILVDRASLSSDVMASGSCNVLPELNGTIVGIFKEKR